MTASYDLTDRIVRSASTEAEKTDGQTRVLALDSGRSFALGEVGGFIWRRLDGDLELKEIAEAISHRFEVSAAEAGRDLLEFIASLAELGLVESGSAD